MPASSEKSAVKPRIIIHGGAGNITPQTLSPADWAQYRCFLLQLLQACNDMLVGGAVDAQTAVVHAVTALELNPLFNAGKGAVFTRGGRNELEASIMVSRGKHKRGAAVSLIRHVKHPILLASEILKRGNDPDDGGAQSHVHISGNEAERLAADYNLEMCDPSYFFTQKRWDEHIRGLGNPDPTWSSQEWLPQGTVGCVALDSQGVIAVATSTGGVTNKLDGRIGDTPTFGSGFWAEQWVSANRSQARLLQQNGLFSQLGSIANSILGCQTNPRGYIELSHAGSVGSIRAVGMSGTGNGDTFLRIAAVRTAAAVTRFSNTLGNTPRSLQEAVTWVAGPGGELQRAAEDRWKKTGEGEGGIIGIELVNGRGYVVADFNCGGMFRAWADDDGKHQCLVFREPY